MVLVTDIKFVINSPIPKENKRNFIKLLLPCFSFVVCIGCKFKGYIEGYYYNLLSTRMKDFSTGLSFLPVTRYLLHNTCYCQYRNVKTKFLFEIFLTNMW